MMTRKLLLIFSVLCFGMAPTACIGISYELQTPTAKSNQVEKPTTPAYQEPQPESHTRASDGMRVVYVPGGTFQMGSTEADISEAIALCQEHYTICNQWYYERESPQHPVSLDGFWIDQVEVSNAQYELCMEDGVCTEPTTCKKGEATFGDPEKAGHPVVCVSWEDAQAYCQWAGGRLPTEAEWEYAFRGEKGLIYPWGDEFDGSKLNYCDKNCNQSHADDRFDDGYPLTAPVGSFPQGASWCGALNMGGNVSEWVADWFGDYAPEGVSNPSGPSTGNEKMVKGCNWFFHPAYCRGALRASVDPGTRFDYLGFRCVKSADQEDEYKTSPNSASIIRTSPPYEKIPWPSHLDDDCIKDTPDGLPEDMIFTPEEWVQLELSE